MIIIIISRWISLVGGIIFLILGTIGAIFNILVFTHRTLRKCSCALYMITAAFIDLFILDYALLLRILGDGLAIDIISMDAAHCALRFFFGQIASFAPITVICLAAMDRWASTCRSVRIRQLSSTRITRYAIIITILVWAAISIPNIIIHRIVNGVCTQTSSIYNTYSSYFLNPVLFGLLPIVVLASFGYATYLNIHQLRNRQAGNRGKVEEQVTRAVILQCASFMISQILYTVWNLYLTITRGETRSQFRADLETLLTPLSRLVFYFNYVSTFYINLAASQHIRRLVRSYLFLLICRRVPIDNRVTPITNTVSKSLNQTPRMVVPTINI